MRAKKRGMNSRRHSTSLPRRSLVDSSPLVRHGDALSSIFILACEEGASHSLEWFYIFFVWILVSSVLPPTILLWTFRVVVSAIFRAVVHQLELFFIPAATSGHIFLLRVYEVEFCSPYLVAFYVRLLCVFVFVFWCRVVIVYTHLSTLVGVLVWLSLTWFVISCLLPRQRHFKED